MTVRARRNSTGQPQTVGYCPHPVPHKADKCPRPIELAVPHEGVFHFDANAINSQAIDNACTAAGMETVEIPGDPA